MVQDRLSLQEVLQTVSGLDVDHVHFQPPNEIQMDYPAIVYKRDSSNTIHADNDPYRRTKRYQVTVIDRDPDSDIPDRIALMRSCSHERTFKTEGLNHDVFNIYY